MGKGIIRTTVDDINPALITHNREYIIVPMAQGA